MAEENLYLSYDAEKNALKNMFEESPSFKAIDPGLYGRFNVKRGLRNDNGTGVLIGLTQVGEVFSYYMDDEEKVPTEGQLYYWGYSVEELVNDFFQKKRFGYEETAYLLLFGELPKKDNLAAFKNILGKIRPLPHNFIEDHIFRSPSKDIMNKIARCVLGLYAHDPNPDDLSTENVLMQGVQLIARFPSLAAYSYMAKRHYIDGESLYIHSPREDYSTAQNLLHLIRPNGEFNELEARVLDLALVLHAEHGGGNNSTFTCRAVSSTGTDTYSAVAAALGSLKGPRHGGAASKTYDMMQDLKKNISDWTSEIEIENYITKILRKEAFDRKGLVYGMGHAVYILSDPRAKLLRDYARQLAFYVKRDDEYRLYKLFERLAPGVINREKNQDKLMCANVDFYSGFIYSMLGIPKELFTAIFSVARVSGWIAHRMEELISGGKIIRPAYKSVQHRRQYIPMDKRDED